MQVQFSKVEPQIGKKPKHLEICVPSGIYSGIETSIEHEGLTLAFGTHPSAFCGMNGLKICDGFKSSDTFGSLLLDSFSNEVILGAFDLLNENLSNQVKERWQKELTSWDGSPGNLVWTTWSFPKIQARIKEEELEIIYPPKKMIIAVDEKYRDLEVFNFKTSVGLELIFSRKKYNQYMASRRLWIGSESFINKPPIFSCTTELENLFNDFSQKEIVVALTELREELDKRCAKLEEEKRVKLEEEVEKFESITI